MTEATIRDVARRAQVSVATVSRALNRLENVSEQTRNRVAEAVRELGYIPHAGARSLSLARTNAIGVVLPDLHGEFFSEIVRGMDREASRRGYLLLLSNLHGRKQQAANALLAMRGRVDGMLVMAPQLSEAELSEALPARLPALLINTRTEEGGRPSIHLDNRAGARAVVEHLVSIGRKRLIHIAGPDGNIDAQERADAFRRACAANKVGYEVVAGDFSEDSGTASPERPSSMRCSRPTTIWRSPRCTRCAAPAFASPNRWRSPGSTTSPLRGTWGSARSGSGSPSSASAHLGG